MSSRKEIVFVFCRKRQNFPFCQIYLLNCTSKRQEKKDTRLMRISSEINRSESSNKTRKRNSFLRKTLPEQQRKKKQKFNEKL